MTLTEAFTFIVKRLKATHIIQIPTDLESL